MKHILRNLLILFLSVTGITYLYRARMKQKGALVRVIVFHDVQNAEWFQETLEFLAERYNVLTPEAYTNKNFDMHRINVLVTFDDGYESWLSVCLPVLESCGFKGVFFVNSGLLDVHDNEELRVQYIHDRLLLKTVRKTLSWAGLDNIHAKGHTIGGHTKTHMRLSKVSEDVQKIEIFEDKKRTEEVLAETLTFFAYPFGNTGDFTPQTEALARDAGYTQIFSTEAGFVTPEMHLRAPRLCLEEGMPQHELTSWIEGGFDLYVTLKRLCVR